MQRLNRSWLLYVIFFIFVMTTASAQAATFNITVTDQPGNTLSGVSVTVTPEQGDAVTGVSDAAGALEISSLTPGIYTVTASSSGYKDTVLPNVELRADETIPLSIALSTEVIQLEGRFRYGIAPFREGT